MINHEEGAKSSHEEGAKSIATNAQRHTSVPQSHVCVLWLPEVGMMLSPKKYVPLRTKVLEMSLEVDDAEEHGLWAFSDGAQEQSTGQRLT